MTCIDVAQDVVFHLHNETNNKFLCDEKKKIKERGGEEQITFACLMSE